MAGEGLMAGDGAHCIGGGLKPLVLPPLATGLPRAAFKWPVPGRAKCLQFLSSKRKNLANNLTM